MDRWCHTCLCTPECFICCSTCCGYTGSVNISLHWAQHGNSQCCIPMAELPELYIFHCLLDNMASWRTADRCICRYTGGCCGNSMAYAGFQDESVLFGSVSLKWIAGALVAISLISLPGENSGGNVAHLGGVLAGIVFAVAIGRGIDITRMPALLGRRKQSQSSRHKHSSLRAMNR